MKRLTFSGGDSSSNRSLYIRSRLASLDFKAFQRVVFLWLGASGYHNLRTLARAKRRGRGSVGPDFLVQAGDGGVEVAVQIRHWRSPLTKRAVDELRGILLRDSIPTGMIICPSPVSRAALIAAADFTGRPIRLIGLESLSNSMQLLGLGSSAFFRTIGALNLGLAQVSSHRARSRFESADDLTWPEDPGPDLTPWFIAGIFLMALFVWLASGGLR